jgi:biotin carboxyl carrier protein
MKMEHVLYAPRAGAVTEVAVKEGDQVGQGALIAALGPERRAP